MKRFLLFIVAILALASVARAQNTKTALLETKVAENGGIAVVYNESVMQAAFKKDSTSRVIVTLRQPTAVKQMNKLNWKDKDDRQTVQKAAKARTDEVMARLAGKFTVRNTFENFSGMVCDVTEEGLKALRNDPDVIAIVPDMEVKTCTAQGIPLMNASLTRDPGTYTGAGISIAIVDTGVDYTHPQLGGGGFPNQKVIGGYNFGDEMADPHPQAGGGTGSSHGTCCAGTAAGDIPTGGYVPLAGNFIGGVAPDAKIYALKITPASTGSATFSSIIRSFDWCVTHQYDDTNNPIMVISCSFGGGQYADRNSGVEAAFAATIDATNAAGITVLCSAGNEGYCNALAAPAIVDGIIAVGAVYDANIGTVGFYLSTDSCLPPNSGNVYFEQSAARKVCCYSNASPLLGVLAPSHNNATCDIVGSSGSSSGDYNPTFGGTSAACPYAAGAAAVLQQAEKAITGSYLTPLGVMDTLASTGTDIADAKNVAIVKPLVDLGTAIAAIDPNVVPGNDLFANAIDLGSSATVTGSNLNATLEAGEPSNGTNSVWWKITPSTAATMVANLESRFIGAQVTVYTGSAVNALTQVTQTTGRTTFVPIPGITYYFAVTSTNSSIQGNVTLTVMRLSEETQTARNLEPVNGMSLAEDQNCKFRWEFTGGTVPSNVRLYFSNPSGQEVYYTLGSQTEVTLSAAQIADLRSYLELATTAPMLWRVDGGPYYSLKLLTFPDPSAYTAMGISNVQVLQNGVWGNVPTSWPPGTEMPVKMTLTDSSTHVVVINANNVSYTFDDRIAADTDGSRVVGGIGASSIDALNATPMGPPMGAGYVRFAFAADADKQFSITATQVPVSLSELQME